MSASRTDRRFARALEAVSTGAAQSGPPESAEDRALESVAVRLVENAAWIQSVLTTVGRATNLGFAQAAIHVEGSGPIAFGLARRLRGFGARVTLHAADPVALLAASLEGVEVATSGAVSAHTLFVFATGEGGPFDVARLGDGGPTVVVVDAGLPGANAAVAPVETADELRPGLAPATRAGREAVVLSVAELRDDEFDRASADVRAAFARKLAAQPAESDPAESVAAADAALAEALLP